MKKLFFVALACIALGLTATAQDKTITKEYTFYGNRAGSGKNKPCSGITRRVCATMVERVSGFQDVVSSGGITLVTSKELDDEGNVVSTHTYKTIKSVDETIFDLDMLYLQNGAVITSETIE